MILKPSLLIISMLLGSILTRVTAYPEYEDEESNIQPENVQSNGNDEIYEPALLQQHVGDIERKLEALNHMDMEAKTEVTLKNVRNISDNQLSNEYISIENEVQHDVTMAEEVQVEDNTSVESTEQNSKVLSKEEEYETENPISKKNRMGRVFITTTTTVPEYIRKLGDENPIVTARDINVSNSDYVENEDDIVDHMIKKDTTNMPLSRNLDNSSEENDDIVPLAMKYYDEIPSENVSSSHRHVEHVSSEDYYEEEYHDPESATQITSTTMPTPDNNLLRTLFAGHTTPNDMISITSTIPTPTPTPQTTSIDGNNPIGQYDPSLFTTSAPLPPPPQSQTQSMLGIAPNVAAAAASVINDKKAKQIPIINTVPVVTTTATTSSRRRLLPHEQLRNYVEDAYIRMPLAVIVDTSVEALANTKTLWNNAMRSDFNVKIVMVTLNKSEELPAAFYFNNTRQFLTGLNSIKAQYNGDAFRGISYAASLIPYDSAIFISTAHMASHNDQVQNSAITLLKKRIRLYLIWFGNATKSDSENETQNSMGGILGEVATRSGGEILHIVGEENSQELASRTHTIVADALRGSQEVDVPVDTTLSSLHVKIDKLMRRAVLETPNGG